MKPLTLAQIQILLHSSIRHQQISEELSSQIKDVPPIPVQRRIGIYQEAYRIRLSECVREDFIETSKLMGKESFERVLQSYINEVESTFAQLAEYSEGFVEYLKDRSPEAYESATKEWMDILSSRAPEPTHKLSLNEIQAGFPFMLQRHPATKIKSLPHKIVLSYRFMDEIHFLDIQASELHWINYFEEPRTLEELSAFIEDNNFSEQTLMPLILNWMQKEILYCAAKYGNKRKRELAIDLSQKEQF